MTTCSRSHEPDGWLPLKPTEPSPCPYLPGRQSQLAFGVGLPTAEQLDGLLERGFRRLGYVFYLPRCPDGCRECQPLRVPLHGFALSRSQRRLLRRHGAGYRVEQVAPLYCETHFELYRRHASWVSSDNEPCTPRAYQNAFVDSAVNTHLFEFRIDDQLVAVSVLDEGHTAVSSVYAFWDPDFAPYSPGTFSALWEIEWARERGKSHYYLGYWVSDCPQMSYKTRFRPHELYDWQSQRWATGR